jgi:ribosomal protein S18 acetylase RimI-like enzyme
MATADDIEALTELHCACFEPDDHLAVLLGKRYIRAMYRWQVSGKEACTVIVESGGEAIALAGVCDGPYMWPMFRACLGEFLVSLLTNPALLVNRRLWRRLIGSRDALDRRARRMLSRPGVAHLTTGAVDANFRGMGIIGKLVRGLEAISQSRGSLALCVGVRRSNHAIRRTFVKLGWSEVPASEGSELLYFITRLGRDPA